MTKYSSLTYFGFFGSLLFSALFLSAKSYATEYEFTPYIGQMFSDELLGNDKNTALSVSDDIHIGLGIAWQESSTGQGQVLLNYSSHDIETAGGDTSFDVLYAHFSGIGLYGKRGYVTTLSLGFGGTYIKTDDDESVYPSATIALGTRYETSANLTFVTELRAYATLIDEDDNLFCQNSVCAAYVDGAVWLDTSISVGLAYKF